MKRRTFLGLLAGAAGVPCVRAAVDVRVVVAGAGMLGAQIAYRLARRGASVTVLEREHPAAGATAKSFAWINATYSKRPWSYFYLNRLGIEHGVRSRPSCPARCRSRGAAASNGTATRNARLGSTTR